MNLRAILTSVVIVLAIVPVAQATTSPSGPPDLVERYVQAHGTLATPDLVERYVASHAVRVATRPTVVSPVSTASSFHWTDASIGAGATLLALLLASGGTVAIRNTRARVVKP
jgi:hypothetical protein